MAETPHGKVCKHAAVQQPNGNWHSKLGQLYVIEHVNPEEIGDKTAIHYGVVGMVFRKANPAYTKTHHAAP